VSTEGEDSAYGRLRTAILSLELIPGERVSERGLEPLLGASRTPVRVALMRLENEGLTQREGRGWRVTPIDLTEVRAVMEYREAIESAAVRLAAERAGDEELAALRALARAHPDHDDEETGLRDFSDFHLALVRLSGNPFLADGMAGALTRLSRTRWLGVRTARSRSGVRDEHLRLVDAGAADVLQPDAARIGGISQFLKLASYAEQRHLDLAPHFAMELHLHLAAAYPIADPWVEHFDWLDPLFNERQETRDGRMWLPDRPGLGVTLSDQARAWTVASQEFRA